MNDILEPKLLRSSAVFGQIPEITLRTFQFFSVHEHLQRKLLGQSTSFPGSFSSSSRVEGKEPGNKIAKRDDILHNIVPRVLRFFAQRLVAKRDSVNRKQFNFWLAAPFTCITEMKKIPFPSVSPGDLHSSAMFGKIKPALTGTRENERNEHFQKATREHGTNVSNPSSANELFYL